MKHYNVIYFFFSLLILISCSKERVRLTAQLGGISFNETSSQINISCNLANQTSDTISFLSMSCSYPEFFSLDHKGYQYTIENNICYKNVPIKLVLPPKTQIDFFLTLNSTQPISILKNESTRIGINFIELLNNDNLIEVYQNNKQTNILWSDKIEFNRLFKEVYKTP